MTTMKNSRFPLMTAAILAALGLSACTSIGYRCPLNETENSDNPTACAGMQDAMSGARKGTGGKTSVLMDDKGRLVPRELLENKPAKPLTAENAEPYRTKSGDPVFHQPKVFQTWTGAFVDAEGNLHDGHTSWFSTPGRWAYGTVDRPGEVGANTMRPALPDTRPQGRIVKLDRDGREIREQGATPTGQQAAPQASAQQERDKAALQTLSAAAQNASPQAKQLPVKPSPAAGVTAPAVGLAD